MKIDEIQRLTPFLHPNSGEYSIASSVTVTITTTTADANLRYTLDGTTPTQNHGTLIAA